MFSPQHPRLQWLSTVLHRRPRHHWEVLPPTGPFSKLPAELLELIARKILECQPDLLGMDATVAAREFAHFVQLSKGFGVISTPLRLEAVSMGRCARPDFGVAGLPFFHQVLFEVEQEIVSRSLLLSIRLGLVAEGAGCCSASRLRSQNREWSMFDNRTWAPVIQQAVRDRAMQLQVAWNREGELLEVGDEAALVGIEGGVLAIAPTPAKTLTPDTELHILYSRPGIEPSHATCRNGILALGCATGTGDHVIEMWDMACDERVDVRSEEGDLHAMWICPKGVLHRLVNSQEHAWVDQGTLKLRRSRPGQPNLYEHFVVGRRHPMCVTYCADTCAVIVLDARPLFGSGNNGAAWTQNLWQEWPLTDSAQPRQRGTKGHIADFESRCPERDAIDLSPRGDCLMMCGRGHFRPTFKLFSVSSSGRWTLSAEITTGQACCLQYPDVSHTAQAHGTWSSCGALYAVIMETVHTGLLMFHVQDSIHARRMITRFWRCTAACLPVRLVWQHGIWAQVYKEHGRGAILRLGFCAPVAAVQ